MELFKVADLDEALNIVLDNNKISLGYEEIDILNSLDRVLYEDIVSPLNVPDFRRSTVDGYAVRFKDTIGASESIPAMLNLKGEVVMGKAADRDIKEGECVYVPTGGMLPYGSDAVVMIEYTEKLDDETILINSPVPFLENVVEIGEDVKKDEIILKKGSIIRPFEIGVMSSLGIKKVKVYKKAVIGIISTGNEVLDINENLTLGKIYDINSYLLMSLVKKDMAEAKSYGIVKDEYDLLKGILNKALDECDIVLISGGSSVGKKDETFKVLNSFDDLGVLIHGIAIKPGKPTLIARCKGKIVFGLPGHPLACSVIYISLVKKYIQSLVSFFEKEIPLSCTFGLNYHKAKGREEYLPVNLIDEYGELKAYPVFTKSGLITGFSKAEGYIVIPKNEEGLRENQRVYVYRL
ncbi:molybdopterin molybdochelatase [Caloramator quimbayensis]|uniref:Molybdopterin molybdenumtransferase n=1 Tax=Caloramator quimbayensis TaxID=1147123 RepID=A0A1T4XZS1_9CLOT|nr:molybdopterin molybdotransferase MoeA [Caloramator quimbayensis]SKA95016.1 molybdopterin molybdochelatase [Caloramator quimbayensis]